MTLSANLIVGISLTYVALLFGLAWYVDRAASRGGAAWLGSPLIYTLSLSVYCTAWTFYGAVGSAARGGLEFATIYLGPTLVFIGWWWLVRKLVRIGRIHRITSIADMISSRYGKSETLAIIATLVAVVSATPYIALQLQSITLSYKIVVGADPTEDFNVALLAAIGLAAFTILFGTRSLDENERHHGVVAAIALEAVVKLAALIAVGLLAVIGVSGGLAGNFEAMAAEIPRLNEVSGPRWVTLLFLAAAAIICLPRQFHVTVVENSDERHLATASWMFPLYLLLISVFVLPIAAAGLATLPEGSNSDFFMLTLPLFTGHEELAILAFIGGFSSATSMVIVSTIALSTMVSNHIVAPFSMWLLSMRGAERSGDVMRVLLNTRRVAIAGILGLGLLYFFLTGGSVALASIGLIAFCGVAQFLPSLLAGIFWHGATRAGAVAGLSIGFAVWCYTLFLPSFGGAFLMSADTIALGPWGISALRPFSLAGIEGVDPLVHATAWSLALNTAFLVTVSLLSRQSALERLQSTLFVDVFRSEPTQALGVVQRTATSEDLYVLAQRILGTESARALFASAALAQGKTTHLPDPSPAFISRLEQELAGSVGAASAHAMVNRTAGSETISLNDLMDIADEAARLLETTRALEIKSLEAERTAAQLRAANEQLRTLDMRKDEFLSQVSHELRTPMTSIRSFAEILEDNPVIDADSRLRFAGIIRAESERLTRLLDEILDMSFLEESGAYLPLRHVDAGEILANSVDVALAPAVKDGARVVWGRRPGKVIVMANEDRLSQVFINLVTNAIKHNDAAAPEIHVDSRVDAGTLEVSFTDNGPGVPEDMRDRIFEKFYRGGASNGAGLGLSISQRIVQTFNGTLYLDQTALGGARFVVQLPLARA
jgi:Na+/proline symporter/nitrogen-specific signal transduction histidine kinase